MASSWWHLLTPAMLCPGRCSCSWLYLGDCALPAGPASLCAVRLKPSVLLLPCLPAAQAACPARRTIWAYTWHAPVAG